MSSISPKTHFLLFPTCIAVKGAFSSIIMDLDKSAYLEIPNILCDILNTDLKAHSISAIKKLWDNEIDEGIDGYFEYLVKKQYGFYTSDPSPFFKPASNFESPYEVISAVLAYDATSNYDIIDAVAQLDTLSCQLLQIRLFDTYDLGFVEKLLATVTYSSIRMVELFVPNVASIPKEALVNLSKKHLRLKLVVYNAEEKETVIVSEISGRTITYTTINLTTDSKEKYAPSLFTISYDMYYESQRYNSGLYRKVSIDEKGNIKNYLSHNKIYGDINIDTIKNVIHQEAFQEKYTITNDQIEKCKDCQFRYMCLSNSDLRIGINSIEKVDSCHFDPYSNTWGPLYSIAQPSNF